MASRFVPVKSEEELRRYHEAGLLYFNLSTLHPRKSLWVQDCDGWDTLLSCYREAVSSIGRDPWFATPEDWAYLVEDGSPNEGDSPTNSE